MRLYYNNKSLKKLSRELRKSGTLAEVLLWNELKGRKVMGYQFMRQKPIKNYIVDFYCSKLKLIIEIDGYTHLEKEVMDAIRQKELERLGLRFLRYNDEDIKHDLENIVNNIRNWIAKNEKTTPFIPLC